MTEQRQGAVYVTDRRADAMHDWVLPEVILGGFEVADGRALTYRPNPNYRVFGDSGLMRLDPQLFSDVRAAILSKSALSGGDG